MTPALARRLGKAVALLGSDQDGEVLAAPAPSGARSKAPGWTGTRCRRGFGRGRPAGRARLHLCRDRAPHCAQADGASGTPARRDGSRSGAARTAARAAARGAEGWC